MIGNQENSEQFVAVATKVPRHVADLLNIIAKARGVQVYELLQWLIYAIVRMAKATTDLPDELRTLCQLIDMDAGWQHAFNLATPSGKMDVAQMILILQQRDPQGKTRRGFGLAMIDKPFMGEATVNYCVDDILERVAEVSMKGLYRQLRQLGIRLESQSLRETLTTLCDAQTLALLDEADRQELPGLGDYSDFGRIANDYGQRTRRKHHYDPDTADQRQQRIQFNDEDRQQARDEVNRDAPNDQPPEDWQPFGVEW